ncbi:hypothetical protein C0995_015555 [Termitomyces sp. Mi166|nr:hypothetical protein C0995_015555 [Termitomyces sp. Mi166\
MPSVDEVLPPLTIRETRDLAFLFCFLWFIANWSLNAALDYTSVASATILSSMSVYGFYVTLLKVRIHFESRIDMQLFFGFVGLFNVLTCWIVGILLHISGIEPFELPTSNVAIKAIIFNVRIVIPQFLNAHQSTNTSSQMFITLSSDYLYVIAMLKTTPLVVTIGLSLTIPLAVTGDLLLGKTVHFMVLFGALIVVFSFVMVGLDDARVRSVKIDDTPVTGDALIESDR